MILMMMMIMVGIDEGFVNGFEGDDEEMDGVNVRVEKMMKKM